MSRTNSYMVSKWLQVWDTQLNTLQVPLPSLPNCRSFKPMFWPLPPYLLQRPCLLPSWKIGKTVSRQHGDFRLEIGVVHILKTSLKVFWCGIYIYSRYRKYCISKKYVYCLLTPDRIPFCFLLKQHHFKRGNHGFSHKAGAPAYLEPCDGLPSTFARGLALGPNAEVIMVHLSIPRMEFHGIPK